MSSATRNAVDFEFGGKRRKLYLGSLQVRQLEKLLGGPIQVVLAGSIGFDAMLSALTVGLNKFEPAIEMEEVAELFDAEVSAEKMAYFKEKIMEAMQSAMPNLFKPVVKEDAAPPLAPASSSSAPEVVAGS